MKGILWCIEGTLDHDLLFDGNVSDASTLVGYVDVDYARDLNRRRCTTGYDVTLARGCVRGTSMIIE